MIFEKRNHPRLKPKGLRAGVIFNSAGQEVALEADVLDISYTGIRVRLKQAIDTDIFGNISIIMRLPKSGKSFSVHGVLKHRHTASECGVYYADSIKGPIDSFLFECLAEEHSTIFIETH